MLEDLIAALIAAAATTPLVSPTLAEPIGALIDGSYNVAATPVRLVTGDIFAWWLSGAFAPFPTGLGTTFAVSLTCYLFALLAKSGEQRAKGGGALGAARLKDAHELRKGSFTWDGRSAPRGRGLVYGYRRGSSAGVTSSSRAGWRSSGAGSSPTASGSPAGRGAAFSTATAPRRSGASTRSAARRSASRRTGRRAAGGGVTLRGIRLAMALALEISRDERENGRGR